MNKILLNKIKKIFQKMPEVKLGYLFGSRANNSAGPLSDFDFALYLDEPDIHKRFTVQLSVIDAISRIVHSNEVDVLILNDTLGPEIKYQIVSKGNLFYEKSGYKVLIEPRILNEYFDFYDSLKRYQLTKS